MKLFRMVAVTALVIMSISGAFAYSGSLSTDLFGGLDGTGSWFCNGADISWNVTQNKSGYWDYSYTLVTGKPSLSHFIVEVSPTFTSDNIFSTSRSFELGSFTEKNGNPNMPGTIYGLKFGGTESSTYTVSFTSDRAPVWGDFYAKSGKGGFQTVSTLWNGDYNWYGYCGLTKNDIDPTSPASNGSVDYHILVPDSVSVVPEPGSLLALGLGAAGICTFSLRRRIKRGGE